MAKKPDHEALCRELLNIRKKHAEAFAREDEIKSELKTGAAENFQVKIDYKLGVVKVSAPKPKRCIGTAPEIVVETFLKLPENQRKSLVERGIVIEAEQWKSAYYGSVTPELF
jgi:hypothetical protein